MRHTTRRRAARCVVHYGKTLSHVAIPALRFQSLSLLENNRADEKRSLAILNYTFWLPMKDASALDMLDLSSCRFAVRRSEVDAHLRPECATSEDRARGRVC